MKLYGYWRSGAAYRVRIGLNLKGIACEQVPVHLVRDGGEHKKPPYVAINPQARVPSLVLDDGSVLCQSSAILEWLEEAHPVPALLPRDPVARAKMRGVCAIIGADVHPLGNVGPLNYLRRTFGADDAAINAWVGHWITEGFTAVETLIEGRGFAFGEQPSMADVYIVPQVFAARRFHAPLDRFPKITRVYETCSALDAFERAAPGNQPDAE